MIKPRSAVALAALYLATCACLTSVLNPAIAQTATTNGDAAKVPSPPAHHKSKAQSETDVNAEIRKELNLPEAPVIHGFHPIKQTMEEITEIESINMRLYEQIKKLEIPVTTLQPTMLQLQNTMLHVDNQMDITHKQLSSVGDQMEAMKKQMGNVGDKMGSVGDKVGAVSQQIEKVGAKMDAVQERLISVGDKMAGMHGLLVGVGDQVKQMEEPMSGLREDLKSIRADLTAVRTQVNGLTKPIEQIRAPLQEVAGPLDSLGQRLDRLQTLVSYVLMAIVLATLGISIGTPIAAAFLIHKRHVFFVQAPSATPDKEASHKA